MRARAAATLVLVSLLVAGVPRIDRAHAEDAPPAPAAPLVPKGRCVIEGEVLRDGAPAAATVTIRRVVAYETPMTSAQRGLDSFVRMLAVHDAMTLVATVRAGTDGRFRADEMPAGWFELEATADDGATGVVTAGSTIAGARVAARLALVAAPGSGPGAAPSSIRGRILDADGKPFFGFARALRHGAGAFTGRARVVPIDAEGRFRFDGLVAAPWMLSAFRPGEFISSQTTTTLPTDDAIGLALGVRQPPLSGRVVAADDGRPIAGAVVLSRPGVAMARTAADGTFSILGQRGPTSLRGDAAGFVGRDLVVWRSETATPRDAVIRLRREAVVEGRVRRADDAAPVAGVRVSCIGMRASYFDVIGLAVSDAAGRYEIHGLSAGEGRLLVEGAGMRRAKPVESSEAAPGFDPWALDLKSGDRLTRDLDVLPGVAVEGVVRDADGAPLPGAVVTVLAAGRYDSAVASDAEGRYRIDGLAPGVEIALEATAPGRTKVTSRARKVPASGPLVEDVTFLRSRRAQVRVVDDATGAPLVGAYVHPSAEGAGLVEGGFSDAAGIAYLDALPLVDLRLSVSPPRGYLLGAEILLPAATTAVATRLRRGQTLSGFVRRTDGSPVLGATVGAGAVTTGQGADYRRYAQTEYPTGADGAFRIVGVVDGRLSVGASAAEDEIPISGTIEVEAGATDLVIVVRPDATPRLRLRILDPEGDVVPRVDASIRENAGEQPLGTIDAGRALYVQPFAKATQVLVRRAREDDDTPLPLGPARVEAPAGATEVVVRLSKETTIVGRVVGPDGRGVAGARVVVAFPGDEVPLRANPANPLALATTRSDADGAFRVGGLGADEYAVWADGPTEAVDDPALRLRGGASNVVVRLVPAVSPTVDVVEPGGGRLAKAIVWIEREGEPARRIDGTNAGAGRTRFARLDPRARFTLHASDGMRGYLAEATIEHWAPADTTVRLAPLRAVSGRVVDDRGREIRGAQVVVQPASGEALRAESDASGRFHVDHVPDGEVVVTASFGDDDYADLRPVRAAAGDDNVRLVVSNGFDVVVYVDRVPEGATGRLFVTRADGRVGSRVATSGSSGDFRFHDVPEGATAVFYAPFPRGIVYAAGLPSAPQVVLVEGLAPRMERGVVPVPARRIAGLIALPTGSTSPKVVARRGPFTVAGTVGAVGPDGSAPFTIDGLVDGPWTLDASAAQPGGTVARTSLGANAGDERVEVTVGGR